MGFGTFNQEIGSHTLGWIWTFVTGFFDSTEVLYWRTELAVQ